MQEKSCVGFFILRHSDIRLIEQSKNQRNPKISAIHEIHVTNPPIHTIRLIRDSKISVINAIQKTTISNNLLPKGFIILNTINEDGQHATFKLINLGH